MEEIKEEWFRNEIYDDKIMEINDYFIILEEPKSNPSRKTPIYNIVTRDNGGNPLGEIKWYGAWRKFCFFPEIEFGTITIWDSKCLKLLTNFLDTLNENYRKENWKK